MNKGNQATAGGTGGGRKRPHKLKKSRSLSEIDSQQEPPRKMRDFMEMKNNKNASSSSNKPAQPSSPTEEETAKAFKRAFGETDVQFFRRCDEEVRRTIDAIKAMPDEEPELEDEKKAKKERKREKRRAKEQKKKEKKKRRQTEAFHDKKENDKLTDKVKFGEVVFKPPELKIKPKGADKAPTKKRYSFLEKFATQGNKFVLRK